MRTSNWIKLIGILCLVIGSIGLMYHISVALLPSMEMPEVNGPEIPSNLLIWKIILTLAGILVNTIYLIAGIFSLIKKPYSIKLMYIALSISILYEILPLLFLNRYDLPYFITNLILKTLSVHVLMQHYFMVYTG